MTWEWIILTALLAGFGLLGFRYYRKQAVRYRLGERMEDSEHFRGGGGCH